VSHGIPIGRDAGGPGVLLHVRHETVLGYDDPVVEAHSEIRKTPVDTGLQRVVTANLTVDPPTVVRAHRDYFGNEVRYLNVLEPHDTLRLVSEAVVETTDAVACGPEAEPDPRPWTARWAEYLCDSPAVPDLPEFGEVPNPVRPELSPREFLDALTELGATFLKRFRYQPGVTRVDSSPAELFEKGAGVCQDFAHAMIGILRRANVPARYASGYIYDPPQAESHLLGVGASHAWVQAWHSELGWVGVDPTNDKLVDWQYVRVAIGRDYSDVQPLRGVFRGDASQRLDVHVTVRMLG
jgi:transglutaminase-like putative cysteine protease